VLIRPAVPDDAQALMDIYNPVVLTSTATFDLIPRTLDEQRSWITDRSGARIVLVAVDGADGAGARVAGYAALSPYRDRAAYSTTVEDSVYVHEDHQGRGVGRILLDALVETARAHGFHAMIARIVSDHEASIGLHAACGFEIIGHEREVGRKFARWLDVTLMERLL
jgi:phosphinothricin acetyltransferase